MTRKNGVTLLDVHLNLVLQTKPNKVPVDCGDIKIMLVFRRLLRLWLDQDPAFVANLVLVFDDHAEKAAHLLQLAVQIGVKQGFIPFAPTPKHAILAAQPVGHVHAGFHRRSALGENVGVGIGRSTRHIAAVRKHIGRAPEQL